MNMSIFYKSTKIDTDENWCNNRNYIYSFALLILVTRHFVSEINPYISIKAKLGFILIEILYLTKIITDWHAYA